MPKCTVYISGQSPSQSAPTILKNRIPCFMKNGTPCFLQKAGWKNRVILYSRREETRLPLLFLNYDDLGFLHSVFFQKAGCPIFKKQGVRFLRIVGADWLGEYLHFSHYRKLMQKRQPSHKYLVEMCRSIILFQKEFQLIMNKNAK